MTKARDTANLTGSGVGLSLLDIDAGTDIGAALVDADLMIVDDGAGGTNRKATMSRLATYMGGKITGGSLVYIASSGAISDAADVQFRAQDGHFDPTKYDHYQFWLQDVRPQTDTEYLYCHVSTDDGSNYDTTNGNYHLGGTGGTDTYGLPVARNGGIGSGVSTEYGVSGQFMLLCPHRTSYTKSQSLTVYDRDGNVYQMSASSFSSGVHLVSQDVDAVQFKMSSGNIESGEIVMYGIANGT
jgi:hypothetical protein